jgi:septal ring factor EnvC (AmiA/AmiB activator)
LSDPSGSEQPHLEAVRDGAEDAEIVEPRGAAKADEARRERRRSTTTIIVLLCLSLAVCVFVMLAQARQTERLQAEVVAMGEQIVAAESALATAEAQVARHEAKLDEVRESVNELLASVGTLQRLVQDEAASTASAPAE